MLRNRGNLIRHDG